MKKAGGSESTIIVGPSKSVLVYALHGLEYVLGLGRFRVFGPKLLLFNNLLTLNTKKCDAVSFTRSNSQNFFEYKINSVRRETLLGVKSLGVIFYRKLSFKSI